MRGALHNMVAMGMMQMVRNLRHVCQSQPHKMRRDAHLIPRLNSLEFNSAEEQMNHMLVAECLGDFKPSELKQFDADRAANWWQVHRWINRLERSVQAFEQYECWRGAAPQVRFGGVVLVCLIFCLGQAKTKRTAADPTTNKDVGKSADDVHATS